MTEPNKAEGLADTDERSVLAPRRDDGRKRRLHFTRHAIVVEPVCFGPKVVMAPRDGSPFAGGQWCYPKVLGRGRTPHSKKSAGVVRVRCYSLQGEMK